MGQITDSRIREWQARAGIIPATGDRRAALNRLSEEAKELIELVALERSGIRDGDGSWYGCDPLAETLSRIAELERQLTADRSEPLEGMTRRPVPPLAAVLALYAPLDVPNTSLACEDSAEPGPVVPETPETRPQDWPGRTNDGPAKGGGGPRARQRDGRHGAGGNGRGEGSPRLDYPNRRYTMTLATQIIHYDAAQLQAIADSARHVGIEHPPLVQCPRQPKCSGRVRLTPTAQSTADLDQVTGGFRVFAKFVPPGREVWQAADAVCETCGAVGLVRFD